MPEHFKVVCIPCKALLYILPLRTKQTQLDISIALTILKPNAYKCFDKTDMHCHGHSRNQTYQYLTERLDHQASPHTCTHINNTLTTVMYR